MCRLFSYWELLESLAGTAVVLFAELNKKNLFMCACMCVCVCVFIYEKGERFRNMSQDDSTGGRKLQLLPLNFHAGCLNSKRARRPR